MFFNFMFKFSIMVMCIQFFFSVLDIAQLLHSQERLISQLQSDTGWTPADLVLKVLRILFSSVARQFLWEFDS
jgi:hypothetical protein